MFQRYFTVWWGRGGGYAAPAEFPFLGLAEPRLCQTQKKSISWRACALQTSRDCKTETAGFETCLREQSVSHYTIEDLIARWKKDELTVEQVIGQLLLLLREHERRLRELTRGAAPGADTNGPRRPEGS